MSDASDLLQINEISSGCAFKISELGELEPLTVLLTKKSTVCRGAELLSCFVIDVEVAGSVRDARPQAPCERESPPISSDHSPAMQS